MDQELKQRLIGAAIITALAAIFVPMLFDEPIENPNKPVEVKIPDAPPKARDVDIAPLPQKPEEAVAPLLNAPTEDSLKPAAPVANAPAFPDEDEGEPPAHAVAAPARHPAAGASASRRAGESRFMAGEEPATSPPKPAAAPKPAKPAVKPAEASAQASASGTASKPAQASASAAASKPVPASSAVAAPAKPAQTPEAESAPKPAEAPAGGTRVYLNAGTFVQKSNAVALQERLSQQGFPAAIKEATSEKGVVYKVRIGPISDKAKAHATKNKLMQINVPTFVAPDE